MKSVIAAIIIFTVGLLMGGLGPRSDLRNLEKEIKSLQEKLRDCDGKKSPVLGEVTRMLGVGKPDLKTPPRPRHTPDPEKKEGDKEIATDFQWEEEDPFGGAENMEDALDAASDLFDIRRQQAMEILINELDLTSDEIEDFESTMSDMNDKLQDQIQNFVDDMTDNMEPSPEDGLRLAHDLSGTLLGSYDDMDDIFPDGWRDDASPDTSPINFIDPRVARPILELEEMMDYQEDNYEN